MKNVLTICLALSLAALFTACKGDKGDEGPLGPPGPSGPGSVKSKTVTVAATDWAWAAPSWTAAKPDTAITADIVSAGAVFVYWEKSAGVWVALPFTYYPIDWYSTTLLTEHSVGSVKFYITDSDHTEPAAPGAQKFKVVVVAGDQFVINDDLDWTNLKAVEKRLGLENECPPARAPHPRISTRDTACQKHTTIMALSTRLTALLLCLAGTASGQTALHRQLQSAASGGGTLADGSTLHWSLGEMSTTMLESGGGTLAQGFWQISALHAPETEQQPADAPPQQIASLPNPQSDGHTQIRSDPAKTLRAGLYDLSGHLLETALARGGSHAFGFAARPPGTYLLRLDDENGAQVQTFKLQKN